MRFSVLLPTRNRAELLRLAIESVRRQDYDDWQIVVADNASTEDIASVVNSFADPRILLIRSDTFLSVTDNWNRAYDACSGEYVIMLGDDDALAPGFFTHTVATIADHERPDLIYSGGWLFTYPNVVPDLQAGGVAPRTRADFFKGAGTNSFVLPYAVAVEAVAQSMSLRFAFDFNMQYSTFRRSFAESLRVKSALFHSPFPDFYASCVMLLESTKTVADPQPLVVIGISPKSYGAYVFNDRADIGRIEFLHTENTSVGHEADLLAGGNPLYTNWYEAMAAVSDHYGLRRGITPNSRRYRRLQTIGPVLDVVRDRSNWRDVVAILSRLPWPDRFILGTEAMVWAVLLSLPLRSVSRRSSSTLYRHLAVAPPEEAPFATGEHMTITDVLDDHERLLQHACRDTIAHLHSA
jgi:glycosyltransferase involved in cell wall biosynthesis